MKKLPGKLLSVIMLLLAGCGITPIEYNDSMLDGPVLVDTSFTDSTFQLSTHPDLASFDRNRPVIICAHGYTACTYEWQEFREFALDDGRVYTSLVLLGGHGRSIKEFEGTSWEEWQAPIMAEYDTLVKLGFTRINLVGASTGGALLLEYLSRNAFNAKTVLPRTIFLVDPIVVPTPKLLHIVNVVGPILGNSPVEHTNEIQDRYWYSNRPASTLAQLNELIELVRGKLEDGFSLPDGTQFKCFKAEVDDLADPVSALLIYKGLTNADGSKVAVEMVATEYHVFTQLAARDTNTEADYQLQQRVFTEMIDRMVAY